MGQSPVSPQSQGGSVHRRESTSWEALHPFDKLLLSRSRVAGNRLVNEADLVLALMELTI